MIVRDAIVKGTIPVDPVEAMINLDALVWRLYRLRVPKEMGFKLLNLIVIHIWYLSSGPPGN